MKRYILGIDQGTTGSTAMLYDFLKKEIIASSNQEFKQIFPKTGWVEHDLNDIWTSVIEVIKNVLTSSKISSNEIISIGITNQRETTCVFNNEGDPLYNAIVWQDRRTQEFCSKNAKTFNSKYSNKTGLPLDAYFSASKMKWLQENVNFSNYKFGTIDTFLLYKLTGSKSYFTEPSNASRTNLMNLETCDWDIDLLNFFNIDTKHLPEIKNTFDNFGETKDLDFLDDGISITCLFGDQQSALFGQAAIDKGDLKCTYGTGAFLLMNTGNTIKHSQNGLLSTVAFKSESETRYALEGSTYIAGAAVQFLRDNLDLINESKDIEELARKSRDIDTRELLLFPFFTGIGSPHWKSEAKATLTGMSRNTNKADISKVCLEGIALSINDLINAFETEIDSSIKTVLVDGGATQNNYLMQLQSDLLQKVIKKPRNIETTVMGCILGALIGSGEISISDIKSFWNSDSEFSPSIKRSEYLQEKLSLWKKILHKLYL